jgi:tRNA1Val (adenine37-N6)-methyltransferase
MVTRAIRSVKLNRLHHRVEIVQGDVRSINGIFPAESFDVVVCNPPYRGLKSGRINPDRERGLARHEIKGGLQDFLRAGAYLLRPKGRMALIFPAARAVDLLQAMRTEGVEPKRLRLVYSAAGSAAALALVEGTKGGRRELDVMPPLVVYAPEGGYTTEAKVILGE